MTDETRERVRAINEHPGEILTPKEVAALLGLTVAQVREKARRCEIQAATIGRQWRFKKEWLTEYLERK